MLCLFCRYRISPAVAVPDRVIIRIAESRIRRLLHIEDTVCNGSFGIAGLNAGRDLRRFIVCRSGSFCFALAFFAFAFLIVVGSRLNRCRTKDQILPYDIGP